MKTKLRLLVTEKCNRNCAGCCNKRFDLKTLPVCTDFTPYDTVMLTGGEPLLLPLAELVRIIHRIYDQNPMAKVILYTAATNLPLSLYHLIKVGLHGITLTIHDWQAGIDFNNLNNQSMTGKLVLILTI